MAGITAIASSKTHSASAADAATSGFIAGEQIALTATPSGTVYQWALALPGGSSSARVRFAGEDTGAAYFTPDVPGVYAVSATVDGTVYTLLLSVVALAFSSAVEGLRLSPVADSQVPTPAVGGTLFWSSTRDALSLRDAAGDIYAIDVTAIP